MSITFLSDWLKVPRIELTASRADSILLANGAPSSLHKKCWLGAVLI